MLNTPKGGISRKILILLIEKIRQILNLMKFQKKWG